MDSKFFRLPASDFAGWAGLIVTILLVVAVAKYIPVVKRFI